MRNKGKISSWNDDKGFGFITPHGGGNQIFIHIKAFTQRNRRPEVGQLVTYTSSTDAQKRTRAVDAALTGDNSTFGKTQRSDSFPIFIAMSFLVLVGISVLVTPMPLLILGLYLGGSLITFLLYAKDKAAAQKGTWRTSESTLHLFSLAGGWPGALVAQQKLRHKSRKQPFRIVFWLTVLLNCGVFVWLFTGEGRTTLESLFAQIF